MKTQEAGTTLVVHIGPDEAGIRDAVGTLQAGSTVSLLSVTTAAEASTVLDDESVDCLVYESEIPDTSPISFATTVREMYPSLRCLLVTADESLVDEALAAGVTDVVVRRDGVDETQLLARRLDNVLPCRSTSLEGFAAVIPDDVYAVDDSGTITDVVPADDGILAEAVPDPTTLIGDQLSTVFTPATHDELAEVFQSFAAGDRNHRTTLTATAQRDDGETVPCEVSIAPFPRQASEPTMFVAVVRDISERLAREAELTAERDFSDLLLHTINDVFYLVSPDGNLERWNDRFREVTGYTDEELAGMDALDFFEGHDKDRIAEAIGETLDTGSATVEAAFVTKDGEAIPYDFTGAELTDSDGTLRGLVGIGRDISDRKERERQLKRERDRITAVFDSLPSPFVHVTFEDGNPIVERVNEAFEETFGFDRQKLRGSALDEYIVPDEKDDVAREIIQRMLDGESLQKELVRKTADGELRDFLFKSTPLVREDGTTEGVAAYVDITERKERIEKLEQLKQNVTDVIWMSTPNKDSMDFISDSYEDVWGRSPASLRENPTSFVDAIHPEDRQRVEEALADQQKHPDEYEETYRVVQPDGEVRWVTDRSSGVYEDGTLTRIVGVASDITERKKREQELELKNRAMDEAPIGITIHDTESPTSTITYANAGFEQLTRYAQAELDGQGLSLLTGADTDPDRFDRLERAFERGEPASVVALLYRRDGKPFWGRVSVAPVTDDEGDVTHFVVFLQNVTETKEHEQEIERRLSEFGEILAQDLQTPIQSAQQSLETAKESSTTEDIETAKRSLERVDKLIDDLTTVHSFSVKSRDVSETVSTDSGVED